MVTESTPNIIQCMLDHNVNSPCEEVTMLDSVFKLESHIFIAFEKDFRVKHVLLHFPPQFMS